MANQAATFSKADTKLYVPFLILSTQGIAKQLQQLKEQSTGINIHQKYQQKDQINILII